MESQKEGRSRGEEGRCYLANNAHSRTLRLHRIKQYKRGNDTRKHAITQMHTRLPVGQYGCSGAEKI